MRSTLTAFITGGLFVALLVLFNPQADQHRKAIDQVLSEQSAISRVLHLGKLASLIPDYHSVVFFSYTKVKDETTSVGALGYIWVNPKAFQKEK